MIFFFSQVSRFISTFGDNALSRLINLRAEELYDQAIAERLYKHRLRGRASEDISKLKDELDLAVRIHEDNLLVEQLLAVDLTNLYESD